MSEKLNLIEKYRARLNEIKGLPEHSNEVKKLETKLKSLQVFENQELEVENRESGKVIFDLERMTTLELEATKLVRMVKKYPELQSEIDEINREIEKMESSLHQKQTYWSELLQQKLTRDMKNNTVTTDDGVIFTAKEIFQMQSDKFQAKDVLNAYHIKKNFATAKYNGLSKEKYQ